MVSKWYTVLMQYTHSLYRHTLVNMSATKKAKCEATTTVVRVKTASSEWKCWLPLESNPYVMNCFIADMGFDTSWYKFTDILSIAPKALRMIPQPVMAVMMLHPVRNDKELSE